MVWLVFVRAVVHTSFVVEQRQLTDASLAVRSVVGVASFAWKVTEFADSFDRSLELVAAFAGRTAGLVHVENKARDAALALVDFVNASCASGVTVNALIGGRIVYLLQRFAKVNAFPCKNI